MPGLDTVEVCIDLERFDEFGVPHGAEEYTGPFDESNWGAGRPNLYRSSAILSHTFSFHGERSAEPQIRLMGNGVEINSACSNSGG